MLTTATNSTGSEREPEWLRTDLEGYGWPIDGQHYGRGVTPRVRRPWCGHGGSNSTESRTEPLPDGTISGS